MADKAVVNVGVDLSHATEAELTSIKNEVLKRLAERARATEGLASDGYDRHGSGHSRATPPTVQLDSMLKR
jgi:hypothetical protein